MKIKNPKLFTLIALTTLAACGKTDPSVTSISSEPTSSPDNKKQINNPSEQAQVPTPVETSAPTTVEVTQTQTQTDQPKAEVRQPTVYDATTSSATTLRNHNAEKYYAADEKIRAAQEKAKEEVFRFEARVQDNNKAIKEVQTANSNIKTTLSNHAAARARAEHKLSGVRAEISTVKSEIAKLDRAISASTNAQELSNLGAERARKLIKLDSLKTQEAEMVAQYPKIIEIQTKAIEDLKANLAAKVKIQEDASKALEAQRAVRDLALTVQKDTIATETPTMYQAAKVYAELEKLTKSVQTLAGGNSGSLVTFNFANVRTGGIENSGKDIVGLLGLDKVEVLLPEIGGKTEIESENLLLEELKTIQDTLNVLNAAQETVNTNKVIGPRFSIQVDSLSQLAARENIIVMNMLSAEVKNEWLSSKDYFEFKLGAFFSKVGDYVYTDTVAKKGALLNTNIVMTDVQNSKSGNALSKVIEFVPGNNAFPAEILEYARMDLGRLAAQPNQFNIIVRQYSFERLNNLITKEAFKSMREASEGALVQAKVELEIFVDSKDYSGPVKANNNLYGEKLSKLPGQVATAMKDGSLPKITELVVDSSGKNQIVRGPLNSVKLVVGDLETFAEFLEKAQTMQITNIGIAASNSL